MREEQPGSSQDAGEIGHGQDKVSNSTTPHHMPEHLQDSWGLNFSAGLENKTDTVIPSIHKSARVREPPGASQSTRGDDDSRLEERRTDDASSSMQAPNHAQEPWGSNASSRVRNWTDTTIEAAHNPPNATESGEAADSLHGDEIFNKMSNSTSTNGTQNHQRSLGSNFSVALEHKTDAAMHSMHTPLRVTEAGRTPESSQSNEDVNSATLANRTKKRFQEPLDSNASSNVSSKLNDSMHPLHKPLHVKESRWQNFERDEGVDHGHGGVNHATSSNHSTKQLHEPGDSKSSGSTKSESNATTHFINMSSHATKPRHLNSSSNSDGETNTTMTSNQTLQDFGESHVSFNHSKVIESNTSTTSQPKRGQQIQRKGKDETLATPLPIGQNAANQTNTSALSEQKTQFLKDVYALWPELLPVAKTSLYGDRQTCVDWDDAKSHKNLTQGACQEIAMKSGHGFYQYAASGCNVGACVTLSECRSFKFQNACPAKIYAKPHAIRPELPWRR
eukprot:TRINITY_DN18447_c0_g1_i2.p1 TRINITY_DN18447_c0_g1~~TRINITY_DN18447_c0_g1_i2.p1  ORF type:complete len:505 (+),score=81.25 TRINITY_DN18447_c0_g1_i2:135-1649(+)